MTGVIFKLFPSQGLPHELHFDAAWYRWTYSFEDSLSDSDLLHHYNEEGEAEGYQPNPYFVPGYVREQLSASALSPGDQLITSYLKNASHVSPHYLLPQSPIFFKSDLPVTPDKAIDWFNTSVYILRFADSQKHGIPCSLIPPSFWKMASQLSARWRPIFGRSASRGAK